MKSDERVVGDSCSWCDGPLSDSARGRSKDIGLDREYSWCCEDCFEEQRYQHPHRGWSGAGNEWPFRLL